MADGDTVYNVTLFVAASDMGAALDRAREIARAHDGVWAGGVFADYAEPVATFRPPSTKIVPASLPAGAGARDGGGGIGG